jgi:uncharacterized membrane protein YccC
LALAADSYFAGGQSPFYALKPQPIPAVEQQESVERAQMLSTVQKMAGEIRALKANVEAMHAAQSLSAKDASGSDGMKTRLDAVRTENSASITGLQRETATKLSQISERIDRIELQIAAQRAATPVADASRPGRAPPRKRTPGGRGDAFDPSQDPTAPGVPRLLGSLGPAASANPSSENAY